MRFLALLMIIGFSVFCLTSEAMSESENICENITEGSIAKHVEIPSYFIAEKKLLEGGVCEIVIKAGDIYMTAYMTKGDYIILGERFSSKVHVSREIVVKHERKHFKEVEDEVAKAVAFTYKPKNVRDFIYFITDPQCPHCENAKTKMKEIADKKGLEIRVLFFPIGTISRDKAVKGICAKMTYEDYLKGKYAGDNCQEGQQKIDNAINVGRKLRVSGVPSFITSQGLILEGFNAEGISSL